jgi:amino acid transporter
LKNNLANYDQMITISGMLGVGLYVRGGNILRLGGPIAVILSFALLGLLAWGVMQCIAEMLCIWPISGALNVYVTEFVDVELGIVVGVAYW